MFDPYTIGETLRLERQILRERQERDTRWQDHLPRNRRDHTVRRWLARALLLLADRLDPRAVVSVTHVPAPPRLNGALRG